MSAGDENISEPVEPVEKPDPTTPVPSPEAQMPVPSPSIAVAQPRSEASPDAKLYIGLAVVLCAIIVVGAPLLMGNQPLPSSVISTQDHSGKPVDLDAAPVIDTAGGALKLGQSVVDLLEARLHAEPQNKVLVKELALAYKNQAARQEDDAALALDSLWRAYTLDANLDEIKPAIKKMLLKSGEDPTDYVARIKSGDAQAKQDCLYGAFSEYWSALDCQPPEAVRTSVEAKLKALKDRAEASSDDNINGAFYLKVAGP
jgi:hypothetical protein